MTPLDVYVAAQIRNERKRITEELVQAKWLDEYDLECVHLSVALTIVNPKPP